MRIVAACCAKNEADVIEAFVRHNCRFVDQLIVLDNGSLDGTGQILQSLVDEGLPLEVLSDPALGKRQSNWMTRLVRDQAAKRPAADWIVALDADEFLELSGGSSLIPPDASPEVCLQIPWRSYVPTPHDSAEEPNPAVRIRHVRIGGRDPSLKVIVSKELARREGAWIEQGNHQFWLGDRLAAHALHPHAVLAHFPLRSAGQYLCRVVTTTLAYLSMPERHLDWGWSCREPFEWLKNRPEEFESTFYQTARQYEIPHARERGILPPLVDQPCDYRGGPLKYTPALMSMPQAWSTIARVAEDLALRHAVLTSKSNPAELAAIDMKAQALAAFQAGLVERDRERSQLVARVEEFREALERQGREIGALQERLSRAESEAQAALDSERAAGERQRHELLAAFHQSWTWRCGRLVAAPARRLREVLQSLAAAFGPTNASTEGSGH